MVKISIKNLVKNFGEKQVLRGINLDISQGQSLVILGGSGCGKTVLIKILAMLLNATSGSVKIDGVEIIGQQKAQIKSKISFLFQLNALFDSYPIWKNICLENIENNGMKQDEAIKLAIEKLKQVGLEKSVAMLYPANISGGMQKRVALARCLTSSPDIMFFDEPTSGLDPLTSIKISHLIKEIGVKEGITKISIMHDIECAKLVADKIIFLLDGKIEWEGTPQEMENAKNGHLNEFIRKNGF